MHKLLFSLLLGAGISCAASVTVNLDNPTLTALAGQTVTFTGTISNTFSTEVFLNSLNVNLPSGFTADTLPFLLGPFSVAGNSTTVNFALFTVTVDDPFGSPLGLYNGTATLLGGADGNAQDILAQQAFGVNVVVPEPALAPGLLVAAVGFWGYRQRNQRGKRG